MLVRQDFDPDESLAWGARYKGSFTSQGYEHLHLAKNLTTTKFCRILENKEELATPKPTVVTGNNYVMGMYAWDSILVAF